jgi:S1-C subfamily serine protease
MKMALSNITSGFSAVALSIFVSFWTGPASASDLDVIHLSRDASARLVTPSGHSSGSAFFIGDQYLLTCFHVVAALSAQGSTVTARIYDDIEATLPSGERIPATVMSAPTQSDESPLAKDFAFVKLKTKPQQPVKALQIASADEAWDVGDEVVFSGYPLATPGMVTHRGMVSGFDDARSLIFVEASINKGNSGGALLNAKGHVIGIVSMREGGISHGLSQLVGYIDKNSGHGTVQIMGVDTLQATRALIQTLDEYISTGIGYARSIRFARDYLDKNKGLLGN